jgi:hypothetical protein
MDFEAIDYRPRYRLCRLGLILCALATGVMAADSAVLLAFLLSLDVRLYRFISGPIWQWGAGSTIVWSALLGSYFLWGRWREGDWSRRSASLLALALAGVGFWALQHGETFGLGPKDGPHDWLRDALRLTARWGWMFLLTGLAAEVAMHLGREEAEESRGTIYALLAAAVFLWGIYLVHQTAWERGWPLRRRVHVTPTTWLLWLGISVLRGLASFLLTALCVLAARECSAVVRDLDRAERGDDLFVSPSEGFGKSLLMTDDR